MLAFPPVIVVKERWMEAGCERLGQHQKQLLNEEGKVEGEDIEQPRHDRQLPAPPRGGVGNCIRRRAARADPPRQTKQQGAGDESQRDSNSESSALRHDVSISAAELHRDKSSRIAQEPACGRGVHLR